MICDLCLKKGKGICVAISEDKIFEAPCDKEGHCIQRKRRYHLWEAIINHS